MRLARLALLGVIGVIGVMAVEGCGGDGYGSGGGGCTAASPPGVYIQNIQFCPSSRTIAAGTTVTWTNLDGVNHTSTSDASSGEFWTSGNIASNTNFGHKFTTPGTFTYHCAIHPTMHGTIIVQ